MTAAPTDQPVVSVVVPTRNRALLLGRTLDALIDQRGVAPFEIVVVDDASIDDTWEELERRRAQAAAVSTGGVTLVGHRLSRQSGPAAARNAGWRLARAPLIAFTDDDCLPQPGWLAALVEGLEEADLVQGCTVPDPHAVALSPFVRSIDTTREWGFYETCNMGYRRSALEKVGGFDETFRYPFGEDTDLAWRVKDAGGRSLFRPDAVVHHAVWQSTFVGRLRELPRREGMVRAFRRNPGLRYQLPKRWFWEQSHPPALLAASGLALLARRGGSPVRRALGLALLAPYIRHRTRVEPLGPPQRWPVVIPQALVVDLAEVAVLAAASVRHRTLLL